MKPPIVQFCLIGRGKVPYPDWLDLHTVWLKAGESNYGEAIRDIWQHCRDTSQIGFVALEYDVAVPKEAWDELFAAIAENPNRVIAIPYICYPASTGMERPTWALSSYNAEGRQVMYDAEGAAPKRPQCFALGATFLPARLLIELPDDLRQWIYPSTDVRMSRLAYEHGTEVAVTETMATHLHY